MTAAAGFAGDDLAMAAIEEAHAVRSSIALTCGDNVGWLTLRICAARVKLPSLATAWKARR